MGVNEWYSYLSGGGLQQLGQIGENSDEEEGFFAVKVFFLAAKYIQQGPLRKEKYTQKH